MNDNASFAPCVRCAAVTPHATNALPGGVADYLFVGTGGTVVLKAEDDSTECTWTVPTGGYVWCKTSHVINTSTATGIVACYSKRN